MSLSIRNYIINIIAGRSIIGSLYDAVIHSRRICSKGGSFNFTFTLQGFGSQRYSARQLINFDEQFKCISLDDIFIKDTITLDDMIIILLKGRNEFRKLYGIFYRAEDAIINAKVLSYTFNNPFIEFNTLNKNKMQFNAIEIKNLFDEANNIIFNDNLIIDLI